MKRTKEDAEQTRQALMEAAERVFGRQGFAASRLSDIAKEADVTRGAIYHHFENKMQLFVALHKERVDPYFKRVDEIFESDLSPKVKIKNAFIEFLNNASQDVHFISRQRFEIFRDVEFSGCEEIHEFMRERGLKFCSKLVELVSYGQELKEIRQDVKPELVALNLMAYMKGMVSILVMEGELKSIKENTEELVETVLKGL